MVLMRCSTYRGNLGLLFYKHYYRDDNLETLVRYEGQEPEIKDDSLITEKNEQLYSYRYLQPVIECWNKEHRQSFDLKTTYPGLVIGTGITHEIQSDQEIKIGFNFDYTTGLPIIPGSSLKGMLRSAFPGKVAKYSTAKEEYIINLLEEILAWKKRAEDLCINSLEKHIFEGLVENKPLPMKQRDIFFAAEITKGDKNCKILGEDYITPHPDPLLSPIPLRFLKVLPNVTFNFSFDLKDYIINKKIIVSAEEKKELFKKIILDLAIGAKTNVGYGHFVEANF